MRISDWSSDVCSSDLLALRGKALLYDFCEAYGVAHRRLGKLVVALGEAGIPKLHALIARAEANGLHDLRLMDPAEVREGSEGRRGGKGRVSTCRYGWSPYH